MLEFSKLKIWSIIAVLVAGMIFALPNVFPEKTVASWPEWAPKKRVNLSAVLLFFGFIGSSYSVRIGKDL